MSSYEHLIENALTAMQQAAANGDNEYEALDKELQREINQEMLKDTALEEDALWLMAAKAFECMRGVIWID